MTPRHQQACSSLPALEPDHDEPTIVETMGAETIGVETIGVETMGAETIGVETIGAETIGGLSVLATSMFPTRIHATRMDPATTPATMPLGDTPAGPSLSAADAWASVPSADAASMTADVQLPRGVSVGRYIIIDQIGEGGMGVVYRAHDPELARQVALKLMRAGHGGHGARTRLLREAQALAQLSHPNVIAVHDVGILDDHVFVAMEFVDGQTLARWLGPSRALARSARGAAASPVPQRSLAEILDVLEAAGRGLAAAHAAGLIHRDFKPENVIVGNDGRVRVLDFGLARATDRDHAGHPSTPGATPEPSAPGPFAPAEPSSEWPSISISLASASGSDTSGDPKGLLDSPLTAFGAIIGTPGYMAPEQYLGQPMDARTDQFAFCVALHRAAYGKRPFAGKGLEDIGRNVVHGNVEPPPADSKVPAWLRAIVLRGLSVDPDARYPSMEALLADLRRGRTRRRRHLRVALAAATLLVVASAGAGVAAIGKRDAALCQGSEALLAEVWSPSISDTLRAVFTASGRAHAAQTHARVAAALDDYGRDWASMRVEACEATHVRGEQSEALLDLRMSCLSRRLGAMRALTRVLADGEGGMSGAAVDRALGAVRQLPDLAACADEDALRDAYPLPGDQVARARIEAASEALDDAEARSRIGQFHAVVDRLSELAERADTIGFPPLQARAHFLLGHVRHALGDLAAAEPSLHRAAQLAARARDDGQLAAAWTRLMWIAGEGHGRYDEALRMRPIAEAAIARAGGDPAREADLLAHAGMLLSRAGRHTEAEPLLARAIEIGGEVWGDDHPLVVKYTTFLGAVALAQGDHARAMELQQGLIATTEAACGTDHLFLVEPMTQLGHILLAQGAYDEALRYFEQSAAIESASLGEDAPRMAHHLLNVAAASLGRGDQDRAGAAVRRAWALVTRAHAADHPRRADALVARARFYLAGGATDAAARDLEQAMSIYERVFGATHERHAAALWHRAVVDLARGEAGAALARFEQVLAAREAALPPGHPDIAEAWRGIGVAHTMLGQHDRAGAALERAAAMLEERLGADSPRVASALDDLGVLELARGRHAAARVALERALAVRERHLPGAHPRVARVQAALGAVALAQGRHIEAPALLERDPGAGAERPGLHGALTPMAQVRAAIARARRGR